MLFGALSGDNYVVNIASSGINTLENGVHRSLEHRGCRCDPERKSSILVKTLVAVYGDVLPGILIQEELIVGMRKIKSSKSLTPRQGCENVVGLRQGVLVHI